jgi:hypothetical protein
MENIRPDINAGYNFFGQLELSGACKEVGETVP